MKMPSTIRVALLALTAFAGLSSAGYADEGTVSLTRTLGASLGPPFVAVIV